MIDIHAHLAFYKLYPDRFLEEMFRSLSNGKASVQKVTSIVRLFLKDKDGSQLIKQMDDAEIEKSVLLIVDDYDFLGKNEISIEENYKLHHEILKKHPDRFFVFAGIHPGRGTKGLDLLKKGVETDGFRGVKLYPPFGFKIDEERLLGFYEYCNTNHLPVLIHTGYSFNGLINENAEPGPLATIADKYKNINFIMAHAGYKLHDPLITSLLNKENVFADISGFQSVLNDESAKASLNLIFKPPYNNKLLYGSDWPITNIMRPLSDQINTLKKIYRNTENTADNAFEKLMGSNARKVLNI